MRLDVTDPNMVRKLAGLAVDNGTTAQKLAMALLEKALEGAPEPKARVRVTETAGKVSALQRHADEVLAVLLDHPEGLTYRGVAELFGWSKATVIEVMRHLRGEGLVTEGYISTGGAPALVFYLAKASEPATMPPEGGREFLPSQPAVGRDGQK